MDLLAHRGLWDLPHEKNAESAFRRAFQLGIGVELDFRDYAGQLVISHDLPTNTAPAAEIVIAACCAIDCNLPIAVNIKADGLQQLLQSLLLVYALPNYFVFDMAVPDALAWIKAGAPTFTRHSEVEPVPAFYDQAAGVWLDGFFSEWWADDVILAHLKAGKKVCIVSSELHGRDPTALWDRLSSSKFRAASGLMLCTDRPLEARALFGA